jgi:hypothetical protein
MFDAVRARPTAAGGGRLGFRLTVALLHLAQPLVRSWARLRHAPSLRRELTVRPTLPSPAHQVSRGVWLVPAERSRAELARDLVDAFRSRGLRTYPTTGWERFDARLAVSWFATAELATSSYPVGWTQVQLRTRLRRVRWLVAALASAAIGLWTPLGGVILAVICIAETLRGLARARLLIHSVLCGRMSTLRILPSRAARRWEA